MVMQRAQTSRPNYGNMILIWLGLGTLLIGAAFVYVYGSLRKPTLDVASSAQAATNDMEAGATSAPRAAQDSLRDLGIDPDQSGLSPEAQTAIARAHQAALSARQNEAATPPAVEDGAAPDAGTAP
ncbi:MAG: hypothetical protein WA979_10310, partial [Pacificimonas sp.]